MTLVVDKFRSLLPPRTKSSPSGWLSFNAPCCHHRGHKPDTRKRAGVRFDGEGIVYNCFNCKFSTGWQPGSPFGEKIKTLCRWLGAGEDIIKELVFDSLKTEGDGYLPETYQSKIEYTEKSLPEGSMSLLDWVNSKSWNEVSLEIEPVISYVIKRGHDPFDGNFYWSPSSGYENRVIIPFLYQDKIVGNTARKIVDGKPKYLSDQSPNFVFNFDAQNQDQRYIFVVEGPFDALAINGVALLTNDISEHQSRIINSIGAEVIVIPDQDQAGLTLIDRAKELGWSVAVPNWEEDIKDVSEAAEKYGRLFVVVDAIKTAVTGSIKLSMAKNRLKNRLQRSNDEKDY